MQLKFIGWLTVEQALSDEGVPVLHVSAYGGEVMEISAAGLDAAEAGLCSGFKVRGIDRKRVNQTWTQPWGENKSVTDRHREMAVSMKNDDGVSLVLRIRAFDDETEIWLNRQWVGKGSWQGRLAPGFYAISSQKEGLDSRTAYFWVEAGETVELNLASPLTDYGSLNVSCDEVNARIFLNGVEVGLSPRVLSRLPADRTYRLRMVKGKKEAEKVIHLKRNDILHVNLKLK